MKKMFFVLIALTMLFLTVASASASGNIGDGCTSYLDCDSVCDGRNDCKPMCMDGGFGKVCFAGNDDFTEYEAIYVSACSRTSDCATGEVCIAGFCTDHDSENTNNPFDINEQIIWDVLQKEIQDGYYTYNENIKENVCSDGTPLGLCNFETGKYCSRTEGLRSDPALCGCIEGEVSALNGVTGANVCVPEFNKFFCEVNNKDGSVYFTYTETELDCDRLQNPANEHDYFLIVILGFLVVMGVFFAVKRNKKGLILVGVGFVVSILVFGLLSFNLFPSPEDRIEQLENTKQQDLNNDGVISCAQSLAQKCSIKGDWWTYLSFTETKNGCCVDGLRCEDVGQIHPFTAEGVCVYE